MATSPESSRAPSPLAPPSPTTTTITTKTKTATTTTTHTLEQLELTNPSFQTATDVHEHYQDEHIARQDYTDELQSSRIDDEDNTNTTTTNTTTNTTTTSNSNSNEDEDGNDNPTKNHANPKPASQYYYVVRRGKSVRNAIFVHWSDAKEQLQDCSYAEYSSFEDIEGALIYALEGEDEECHINVNNQNCNTGDRVDGEPGDCTHIHRSDNFMMRDLPLPIPMPMPMPEQTDAHADRDHGVDRVHVTHTNQELENVGRDGDNDCTVVGVDIITDATITTSRLDHHHHSHAQVGLRSELQLLSHTTPNISPQSPATEMTNTDSSISQRKPKRTSGNDCIVGVHGTTYATMTNASQSDHRHHPDLEGDLGSELQLLSPTTPNVSPQPPAYNTNTDSYTSQQTQKQISSTGSKSHQLPAPTNNGNMSSRPSRDGDSDCTGGVDGITDATVTNASRLDHCCHPDVEEGLGSELQLLSQTTPNLSQQAPTTENKNTDSGASQRKRKRKSSNKPKSHRTPAPTSTSNKSSRTTFSSRYQQYLANWEEQYNLLVQHLAVNGRNNNNNDNLFASPSSYNPSLLKWMNQQRTEYRKLQSSKHNKHHSDPNNPTRTTTKTTLTANKSKLTAQQIQRLNDIGFTFRPKRAYASWNQRLEELRSFRRDHGHARVPTSHPTLGSWVHAQRRDYKRYRIDDAGSKMTDERLGELEKLDFVFEVAKKKKRSLGGGGGVEGDGFGNMLMLNDVDGGDVDNRSNCKTWEERYEELKAFKEVYGHVIVPQNHSSLGWWVNTQRKVSEFF